MGNVSVADSYNYRIKKFSRNRAFITAWGTSKTADGQLTRPNSLATDLPGNVFVADTGNQRIQKFSASVL